MRKAAEGRTRRRIAVRLPAAEAVVGITRRQVTILPVICAKAGSRRRSLGERQIF